MDGKFQSYLTGEWKDASVALRRPFGVMSPNNKPALPQYGISAASIVYEAPVEGAITRLMYIVEDYDDLSHIGPVRSARDYYVYEAIGKNAFFCHWGLAVPYCSDLINSSKVDNISVKLTGVNVGADEAFKRISRLGKALEFTGYMIIDGYKKAVERLKYDTAYSEDFVPQFTFAAENTRIEYEDFPAITDIYPGGSANNGGGYGNAQPHFAYNADDFLYYRYEYGGKHIDEMNDQQVAVSNVVLQHTKGWARDAKGYLQFDFLAGGKAQVFTNGKMIEGTWTREAENRPAKFYDDLGNEIVFNQGKTWICVIRNDFANKIVLE
ncbi:MAG: DUF3048 domain-containing protein [Lachnospiraceae bacterium]|nr:DUF3048 domain-containing protein [Lachnospiraceae bacterium]